MAIGTDLNEFHNCQKTVIQEISSNNLAVLELFIDQMDKFPYLERIELHAIINLAAIRQRLLSLVFCNQIFV